MKKAVRLTAVFLAAALLGACAVNENGERNDPLEKVNRVMWDFNYNVMDPYLLEPAAKVWRNYVPTPVSSGLVNVANNLDEPVSFVSRLLEGEPRKAFVHFNRFWINTIFGLGGLIDVAGRSEPLQIDAQRGLGETLGTYGIDPGAYVMLPVYNATTPRQLTGAAGDAGMMYPFWNWVGGPWSLVKYGVQAVDGRAKALDQTELLRQAQDPYITFREAYYQNLAFKVNNGKIEESPQKRLSDNVLKEID